eukprot:TRINITY_DN60618_c0_g1_i4.p1 TRINITY_DN60618_c0_g1~~TRINITY_DN60618_c0_g1_i4.p1  ORF type:complete len:383 (-),score=81.97 TRINITY_DN60618_c0_g1_i4:99-1247(-)
MRLHHHDIEQARPALKGSFQIAEANTQLLKLCQQQTSAQPDPRQVASLIEDSNARVECVGVAHEWTPLMLACYYGNLSVAQQLIQQGAKVSRGAGKNGSAATHAAACGGKLDLLKSLVQMKADPFVLNKKGQTAADIAAQEGWHDIVDWLKQQNPDRTPQVHNRDPEVEDPIVLSQPLRNQTPPDSCCAAEEELYSWLETVTPSRSEDQEDPLRAKDSNADPLEYAFRSFSGSHQVEAAAAASTSSGTFTNISSNDAKHTRHRPTTSDLIANLNSQNRQFFQQEALNSTLGLGATPHVLMQLQPLQPPRDLEGRGHDSDQVHFHDQVLDGQVLDDQVLSEANNPTLSLIHISEPTRLLSISYAVFCLKKKKKYVSCTEKSDV